MVTQRERSAGLSSEGVADKLYSEMATEIDAYGAHDIWGEARPVPGHGDTPRLPAPVDLVIGSLDYRPADDRRRVIEKVGQSANEEAQLALDKHRAACEAEQAYEDRITNAALNGQSPPRTPNAAPDLFRERDTHALIARAHRDRQYDLLREFIAWLPQQKRAMLDKAEQREEQNAAERRELAQRLMKNIEESAEIRGRHMFVERATGPAAGGWHFKAAQPGPDRKLQELVGELRRVLFPPSDGNQHQPFGVPTSLGGSGTQDIEVTKA